MVLGATGMLGNALVSAPSPTFEMFATIRGRHPHESQLIPSNAVKVIENVNAENSESVKNAINIANPDVVINAIGIVKQLGASITADNMRAINTNFPKLLENICITKGIRLIHFSTDCVFSGNRGNYLERDIPDPIDLYGVTKLDGEVSGAGCTTIRTSFIGHEVRNHLSLLEWAISQKGQKINGYTEAFFSGLTTIELRRLLWQIIESGEHYRGIWHMASHRINKFDLLTYINKAFDLHLEIIPDDSIKYDRSIDGSRLSERLGYAAPSWLSMIDEMAQSTS